MKPLESTPHEHTVVGLGEALFDCFDGHRKLGGAPINFAIHCQQLLAHLGGTAAVVSRVGSDDLGKELLNQLRDRSVDVSHVQHGGQEHPTGVVQVALNEEGQPSYQILEGAAWDFIELPDATIHLASRCSAVCFGTLAQRSVVSRDSIQRFVGFAHKAIRFLDVNLRQSYYDADTIESSLRMASVAKFNEEELVETANLLGLANGRKAETEELAHTLCRVFDLDSLAVTRGSRGTLLFTDDGRFEGHPGKCEPETNADSVGAGDACNAGLLFGLLMGWPMQEVVQLANEIGAFVASRSGATPTIPDELIQSFRLNRHMKADATGSPTH